MRPAAEPGSPSVVRGSWHCGAAARWLPRVLAAAVLVSAMLAAARLEALGDLPFLREFRIVLVTFGALAALWILRRGGEVRLRVTLAADRLDLVLDGRGSSLPLAEIDGLRYEPPLGGTRSWIPAMVVLDRTGTIWRLPTLLGGGEALPRELVRITGRDDLRTWTEVLALERRMSRGRLHVAAGYAISGILLGASAFWYLH